MRIGVFGGSFDPPHLAHLTLAESAAGYLNLDLVFWIPAARPPHRSDTVATARQRLDMVALAISDDPRFVASDIEISREGLSFTVDTLADIRGQYPEAELFVILGGDSLANFDRWRDPFRILEYARLVVYERPDVDLEDVDPRIADATVILPNIALMTVSSTEVRRRIRAGQYFGDLVPEAVGDYIREHDLYH